MFELLHRLDRVLATHDPGPVYAKISAPSLYSRWTCPRCAWLARPIDRWVFGIAYCRNCRLSFRRPKRYVAPPPPTPEEARAEREYLSWREEMMKSGMKL